MKYGFFLFMLLLSSVQLSAQKAVNVTVDMLGNDKIAEVNVNEKTFVKNVGNTVDLFTTEFKQMDSIQKIVVLITYHKSGKPDFECYSNPKLNSEIQSAFMKKLSVLETENTKLVDFPLIVGLNIKQGYLKESFPEIILPNQKRDKEYESADLKHKYELNKAWAINEVLPVLSAYEAMVDDKFAGVKNFGKLVSQTNFNNPQDIDKLTSENPDYWRATMEMEKGNLLIPLTKVFILISQGKMDYALKYVEMLRVFIDTKTISNTYLDDVKSRLKLFNDELNDRIGKGIAEHDKGNYQKAIAIYNTILTEYPYSAWAQYEQYYSQNAIDLEKGKSKRDDRALWDKSKVAIYASNPIYSMDVRASNGKEAYLLFRRQEMGELFQTKGEVLKDVFKYADIALDLKVYDFAAQLFWFTFTFEKDSRDSLISYLYCLEHLKATKLKENFEGDFEKDFKNLEESKEKEMKKSEVYNSMKN
jgi:tetratricopeptide (TPR) repeat protein